MDKKENTKILIVCFSNLRSVPYISSYTNILDNNNLKYDVVYWRRYNIEEKIFCNCIRPLSAAIRAAFSGQTGPY